MIIPVTPRLLFSMRRCDVPVAACFSGGVASVQIGFRREVGVKFRAGRHSAVVHEKGNGKRRKVAKVHRNSAFVVELCHLRRAMTRHLFRPISHAVQGTQIYRFSVNFLRFAWFFEKGFSHSYSSASPREIKSAVCHECSGWMGSREGAKEM
jgi:hypothetical protein